MQNDKDTPSMPEVEQLEFLKFISGSPYKPNNDRYTRRIRTLRVISILLAVTTLVFLVLFLVADSSYTSKCKDIFDSSIDNAVTLIGEMTKDNYDYDTKYREVTAELNTARRMIFSTDATDAQVTSMTQLYYMTLKMPVEFQTYIYEVFSALKLIQAGNTDEGVANIDEILSKVDYLNY